MAKLFNRAKMTTTTTGSGTITLGSASNGFQSFADAGVADGDVVQYVIEEGANFEIGTGTYSATGTSLTRTPSESSNSDNAITLAGQATVSITAVADDLNRLQHNGSDKVTVSSTGISVTGNITVSGNVDGRDVSSDGSKLDGIDANANNYSLPLATASVRGGAKIGYTENGKNYPVELSSEQMYVNVPWTDTNTTYSTATSSALGLVKIGYTENGKNYPVELSSGQMYVNVPWTDTNTDTDTTYSLKAQQTGGTDTNPNLWLDASSGTDDYVQLVGSGATTVTRNSDGQITISSTDTNTNTNQLTTFQLEDGDGTEVTISHGKEVKFVEGGGIDINWTDTSTGSDGDPYDLTFTHADTSSQGSVNNSNGTVIQDVTIDGYGHVTALGSVNLDNRYTLKDHIRSIGTPAFTGGTNPNITTAQLVTEMENDGSFDSYSSVFKTSWSYAGNYNLSDAGGFTETAGTSWLTWTDNSSDSTRGNITALAIAPNTGGSAGGVFIYNDQGSSYSPGWREVWTSMTDGSGSGLDADLLDGQHGSYYYPASNPNGYTTNVGDITGVTAGSGLTGGGTSGAVTVSHSDTSSQASVNNSGNTVIQDVTLDTFGHVTGLTSKALSIPAAANNATITLSAGTGLSGGGNFTTNQSSNETITFNLEAPYTYIDTATGNYGTVKVDDDRGVTWAGYAIRDDWVFMSNGATTAGLYNDTDNEWHVYMTRNGATDIRYNGSTKLATTNTGIDVTGDIILNDTTTKISEGSSDAVRISTDDGYVDIGPMNTSWCHLQTDRSNFYMNAGLRVNGTLGVYNQNTYLTSDDMYLNGVIYHYGDTNTYMQFHAADQWRVVVGGTERLEVKNSSPHVLVTGDLNSTSDARLKENVNPIANALSDIAQLEGVSFDWKDTGTRGHGFIAQQVEPILPDVVQTDEETGIKSINYVGMIGHLVEAIKELKAEIDELKCQ